MNTHPKLAPVRKTITIKYLWKGKLILKDFQNVLYQPWSDNDQKKRWKWISLKSSNSSMNSLGSVMRTKSKGFDDYKKQWT
jgi:hypothetical protein